MRQRIIIQAPTVTVDSYGQPTNSWVTKSTQWAQIEGSGGGTGLVVDKGQVTYSHTVRTRMSSLLTGINETWRILYGSKVFQVSSITNQDLLNTLLVISCTEEVV